jgi:hypothetical protein
MGSAWFGLLGVIVGALITTLTALVLATRKELGDGVVAARLLRADLLRREAALHPGTQDVPALDGELWDEHRSALARVLSHKEWELVSACYPASPDGDEKARLQDADALLLKWKTKRSAVFGRLPEFFNKDSKRTTQQ